MTRGVAWLATGALLASACTGADSVTPVPLPAARSTAPPSPSPPELPRPAAGLVPAVMLSSTIRTPAGQIRTGIGRPATFVQARGGFVVQDTAGVVYRVDGEGATRIGRANPAEGLALVSHASARHVAWASPADSGRGRWRVQVYDSLRERLVRDTTVATPDGMLHNLAVDDQAFYYAGDPGIVVRIDLGSGRRSETAVPAAYRLAGVVAGFLEILGRRSTRLVPLDPTAQEIVIEPASTLSPTGEYAISLRPRLHVQETRSRRDVTPDLPDVSVRQLVWLGADRFTVEVPSASLISPPDGDVWNLYLCRLSTGRCSSALTGVTGTALSIPGTPIRSSYGR